MSNQPVIVVICGYCGYYQEHLRQQCFRCGSALFVYTGKDPVLTPGTEALYQCPHCDDLDTEIRRDEPYRFSLFCNNCLRLTWIDKGWVK